MPNNAAILSKGTQEKPELRKDKKEQQQAKIA